MITGGRDGIGGGGVFLADFFLFPIGSANGCLVSRFRGSVFERGLEVSSSDVAVDDLESNTVSSSTLMLL